VYFFFFNLCSCFTNFGVRQRLERLVASAGLWAVRGQPSRLPGSAAVPPQAADGAAELGQNSLGQSNSSASGAIF